MSVRLIFKHIEHHARHSGYDQLVKYVDGEPFVGGGRLQRNAEAIPWEEIERMPYYYSPWYGGPQLRREIEIRWRMRRPTGTIYHFLYAENDLRYTALAKWRWNNKIVGSFHQPPEYLEREHETDTTYIRGIDAVVVMSSSQIPFFERYLPREKIYHVPHGVDAEHWCPAEGLPRFEAPTFLLVGQWLRDIDTMTRAARILMRTDPDIRFRVVTFEEERHRFEGLTNTTVMVGISDEQLLEESRRAHALFLPLRMSTANNAVLEAMSCGTPVVSSEGGGVPEYVGDGGLLTPPADAEAAAEALRRLSRKPALVEELGRNARRRIERHYAWPIVGQQMDEAYRAIRSGQPRVPRKAPALRAL